METRTFLFSALLLVLFTGCKETTIVPSDEEEVLNSEQQANQMDHGPVTDCDENLSAYEMLEIWEMMNAKTHDQRNICFEGYVLSNETYGDLVQGSIAFEPFADGNVEIPSVYCQFTGENGAEFLNYEIGDPIKIMGKMMSIDNQDKHNFMFAKCSFPSAE